MLPSCSFFIKEQEYNNKFTTIKRNNFNIFILQVNNKNSKTYQNK